MWRSQIASKEVKTQADDDDWDTDPDFVVGSASLILYSPLEWDRHYTSLPAFTEEPVLYSPLEWDRHYTSMPAFTEEPLVCQPL